MAKDPFAALGAQVVNPNWNGTPTTLAVNDSVMIPNAPNGSAVLGWQNVATMNNDGTLTVASGGPQPTNLDAPVANKPSVWANNWTNQNISIFNTSANPATPIWVELYGMGLGPTPQTIVLNTALSLPQGTNNTAQGTAPATWFRITLTATPGNKSVIAVIGGPTDGSGNNAFVYGLAWDSTTVPKGYTNVTTNNSMALGPFQWSSAPVFVANMSSGNAGPVTLLFQSLGG